ICIIVPDFPALAGYAKRNNLSGDIKSLVAQRDIQAMITDDVIAALKNKYADYEVPKKFLFLDEPFTLENGMLTQTMKLKRRVVMAKYNPQIEALYGK
ncbi:MAG TPA: hypothetical protein PKZ12_05615, partial [Smithellaceae bacterium]|nr:hypothetical protein [Smithellaceae bacterium]